MIPYEKLSHYDHINNQTELVRQFGALCWAGPDIHTSAAYIVGAKTSEKIGITITPDDIPSVKGCTPSALELLRWSARSRWAQLGINPKEIVMYHTAADWL